MTPSAPSKPDPSPEVRAALSLTVDSRLGDVALAAPALRAACESAGLGPDAAGDVELAVVELLNNVVVHGHAGQAGHATRLELAVLADGVRIRIHDTGLPIPEGVLATAADALPDLDPADIAALPESGMGLRLVRSCVDEMEYRSAPGDNMMTLEKYFDGAHRAGR